MKNALIYLVRMLSGTFYGSQQTWSKGHLCSKTGLWAWYEHVCIGNIEKSYYMGFQMFGQTEPFLAVLKKKLGRLWATFEGCFFFMFSGAFFYYYFFSFSEILWNGRKIRKMCSTEVRALKVTNSCISYQTKKPTKI